ncbi:MAG: ATP-binding protein [Elusimicrobiota bacterium]
MPKEEYIGIKKPARKEESGREEARYRSLWRLSVIVTSLVAIIPLLIMTGVDYVHDREASRIESGLSVNRILSTNKRSLEVALEERLGALSLVLSENSYRALANDAGLSARLRHLQVAFGGFVDLGVIGSDGVQIAYSGPYDLKGKSYQSQDWFHEALLRGTCVSDVFMGYRNFPHIVIARRHPKDGNGVFILKATLDMNLLKSRLHDLELDIQTDAFLINKEGVLQTPSASHGPALKKVDLGIPPRLRGAKVVQERRADGARVTSGYAAIEKTPFTLVVIKRQANPFDAWLRHRPAMLWFLGISIAMILAVVLFSSRRMVTSLREADARRAKALHDLEYTNKLATIGRMAASVAHEINNPLAIINEDAGLLQDMATFAEDHPQKEKTLKLVDSIQRSVQRCGNVTHRLLGFAKRMDIRREPISLDKLIEEVIGFQQTEAVHRNIRIECSFPETIPPILSDRGKLQQVFLNILSNALAAVEDGGRIDIRVTQVDNNREAVIISDNGTGISDDDLGHIFEPFYSTKGEFGTGLGLSITRDIVAKLGGTIDVRSKVGRGTSFIVTLPIKSRDYQE